MATAMELRVPMGASKHLAGVLLALAASVCAAARDASTPAGQTSSQPSAQSSSSSQPHRSAHHIQVPVEDDAGQSPELSRAEAAIEKKDYPGAESLLRKLVESEPA